MRDRRPRPTSTWSVNMLCIFYIRFTTLYTVGCSFVVMHATYWTKGWRCVRWGHSVNHNRQALYLSPPIRMHPSHRLRT